MGIYYFLLNDTKKECVHLDHHFKHGPMTMNDAVHYALVNYMMDNEGDSCRIVPEGDEAEPQYKEINLLEYPYEDEKVIDTIVNKLNIVYGRTKYKIVDGAGVDLDNDGR